MRQLTFAFLSVFLCLTNAYASVAKNTEQPMPFELQQMGKQIHELQRQIKLLSVAYSKLEHRQHPVPHKKVKVAKRTVVNKQHVRHAQHKKPVKAHKKIHHHRHVQRHRHAHKKSQPHVHHLPVARRRIGHRHRPVPGYHILHEITYVGGTPVVTSPYLGIRSAFDGSDLIVNIFGVNLDARLLQQKQMLTHELALKHLPLPSHPIVELSGKLDVQAFIQSPFSGSTRNDIDLTGMELDAGIYLNPWVLGYLTLKYDNFRSMPQRVSNSRLFLDKGFLTLGNFDRSPLYASGGQMVVPFGLYSSHMLTAPFTFLFGNTRMRAVLVGLHPQHVDGPYGAVYFFEGDVTANGRNNGGVNFGFKTHAPHFSLDVGGGLIANIADSLVMQSTGGTGFTGFGACTACEVLLHQVPAYDAHIGIDIGPWNIIAEYIATVRRFDPMDLTFNGHGAEPSALNTEVAYHFDLVGRPANIAVGYGLTHEAYALNLPLRRYIASFNIALWRDTIQTLEYRHDVNYAFGTLGAGRSPSGLAMPPTVLVAVPPVMGRDSDTVSMQFSAYF